MGRPLLQRVSWRDARGLTRGAFGVNHVPHELDYHCQLFADGVCLLVQRGELKLYALHHTHMVVFHSIHLLFEVPHPLFLLFLGFKYFSQQDLHSPRFRLCPDELGGPRKGGSWVLQPIHLLPLLLVGDLAFHFLHTAFQLI